MNKIALIIRREYITRVRKKSFLIMTFLTPFLFALIFIIPALVMTNEDKDFKKIAVIEDGSDLFTNVIPDTKDTDFEYLEGVKLNDIKNNFAELGYYGVLYISPDLVANPDAIQLISRKQPPIGLLDHISGSLEKEIEKQKLLAYNIENLDEILRTINTSVRVQTIKMDETGSARETSTGISMALAYIGGFLMYMLVFMFGSMVMRGVIEEKTNRIVEVIVSSVKPVQLMLGKIIGVALVGLTQFALWIVLTLALVMVVKTNLLPEGAMEQLQQLPQSFAEADQATAAGSAGTTVTAEQLTEFQQIFAGALSMPWGLIIFSFVFYFLTGYLLYASLFAAIGSAVDNETETQQFMLPVTIPIILGLVVAMGTMQNPESSLSFWFSIIPLTSPIVMMARIPFDVPAWEIALSMGLMLLTIVGAVWMAAKIYRTGILMYGKKTSYKELWKWLTYKG
ncbi:MAG: ABC transporter permease [Bacteroidales bacterium]|jgi:ABC-2 type transport system permease protein|nr:ABC transporter permease [Bacteroidales bacterium]MDX9927243.1 ABC transporter permease [Bacteroidales bacterium]HNX83885.1 ABC transporter permease [Bacteroidales bacterium]HOC48046.1 ABC transporter permease [Bacteroidales bacterium]HPS97873.1 ABC transporter permease [Bacteroidales bacterium]